jgi:hypothetical protein
MCEAKQDAKTKTEELILSVNRLTEMLAILVGVLSQTNQQSKLGSPEK